MSEQKRPSIVGAWDTVWDELKNAGVYHTQKGWTNQPAVDAITDLQSTPLTIKQIEALGALIFALRRTND